MSEFQKRFDPKIWKQVNSIPAGRVMSYGDIARAAGFPRHARMVSKAMSRSTLPLPWHRVIRSNQTLAFEKQSDAYKKQKKLLEKEGVIITNGKVIALQTDKNKDLDEVLWG